MWKRDKGIHNYTDLVYYEIQQVCKKECLFYENHLIKAKKIDKM